MPFAADAAKVNVNLPSAQQLKSTGWSGEPTVSEGTVLVAAGATISQSIGSVQAGKYILTIDKLVSTDCALNVNFGGITKTIAAASTSAELTFELTSAQDVTITISSADAKAFQVTDVKVVLDYDFEASYKTFNDALVKVTSLLNQIDYNEKTDLLAKAQVIQKKIDEINITTNEAAGVAKAYTDVYVKYALYGDDATNAIMDEIAALRVEGVNAVNAQYVKQLKAKLSATYDGQTSDVKAIVKAAYDQLVTEINTFDNNNVVDDKEYQALLAKIDNNNDADNKDLKDKIRDAKNTASDLKAAYDDVKGYINGTAVTGCADYSTQWTLSDGTNGSAYDIYSDINAQLMTTFAADRYKNILAAAQKELTLDLQKVSQAEKDNEAAYKALSYKLGSLDYGLQTQLKADVDAAVAAMQTVLAKYTTTKNQLDAADAIYNTVNGNLTTAKNTHKVGLEVSQIKSKLTAAENAVKAVKDAIEAANVTTSEGDIAATMAALDLSALQTAASTAIMALNTTAAPYTAHQNAIKDANTKKANLDTAWGNVKTKAGNYKYDSEAVSTYFATTISAIETRITKLNTALTTANNGGAWSSAGVYSYNTTFYSSTIDATISAIQGLYTDYNNKAKDSQDNYNVVVNSKNADGSATANDGIVKLQAALDAANDKVKDLAIYNDVNYNYAQKVVDIQAKIDAVKAKITNAKKLKDANHYNVMSGTSDVTVSGTTYKKVELDLNIATDIAYIEANYATDNTNLEASLKAAMLAATAASYDKLVDDINSLDGDAVKYGKSYEAINKGRTDIKAEEKEKLYNLDKTAAAGAINAANSEKLAEIQANISTIREKLDELLAVAKQAADLVEANQDAQKELVKAIYDGDPGSNVAGNLEKYYADKITKDAAVNNATALAEGDAASKAVKDYNDAVKAIAKAITDLKAKVGTDNATGTDRVAETLAANKATHLQTIATIKANIDDAKAKAEAATANYNKYQEFITATTGKIAVAQAALTTAIGKANTADAANADYTAKTFVKNYQDKLTKASTGATALTEQYYKNGTMVANASTVQGLVDEVNNFASGLEATAKDNKEAYDKLEAEWAVVKALWNTVSTDIAKSDESSAREDFQEKLKAELDKLNKNKTDYTANYAAIALPNADRVSELANIKNAIKTIKSNSLDPDAYKERIATDNAHMLEIIKAAVADAGKEYNLDTDTLKMFKNVNSDVLVTSLATVETEYNTFNDKLYKYSGTKTFVEVINAKYKEAADAYAATVSPDVFDKDSAYVFAIRNDIAQLVASRESFMTAIRTAIATETAGSIAGYQTQIDNVVAELKALKSIGTKISDATAKAAVKDEQDKLAAAKDAVAAGIIPDIDEAFAALDNITAELAAAKFNAMRTKLDADIAAAEAYVEQGKAYLANDADNLATFTSEAIDVTTARSRYNTYNTAARLIDARYDQIQDLIAEFKKGGNNTYETIYANNNAWPTIQGYVTTALKTVQDAIDGIQDYAAAGQVQQALEDNYRTHINAMYDTYEQKYQKGTLTAANANSAKTVLTGSRSAGGYVKDQVKSDIVKTTNAASVLYLYEAVIINDNLSELEAEYNKFAASDLTDITASEEVKAKIEAIKTALGNYSTQTKTYVDANGINQSYTGGKYSVANTSEKLLAQQKAIAELMSQLLNANYGEGVSDAAAKAELEGDLAKVKSTFDKSGYTAEELAYAEGQFEDGTPFTNADLNGEIAQLEAAIAAIEAEIAAGDNLYYNKENIANKIAAAQKQATAIKTKAATNKANLTKVKTETAAAYTKLLTAVSATDGFTSIKEINNLIDAAKTELDKNTDDKAKAAAFTNMLNRLSQKVSDQEAAINEAKEAGVLQTSAAFATLKTDNVKLYNSTVESLYDIKNTAADRELTAQAKELQAQLDAITYDENRYTLGDQKSLAKQKKAIDEAINGTDDGTGTMTGGLVQEIAAAKAQDYELDDTGTAVVPSTSTAATTSYVYLQNNGKNSTVATAKVKAIQKLIDALKKDITDNAMFEKQDVNGDNVIDILDIQLVINAFGTANGNADVNGDGVVDILDIQEVINKM